MTYQVLARKWRPQNFTQLVGQEHVSQSLCNALQHNRLHHAYLFTGTRGVGKTTIARILAKAINCKSLQDYNPCGECSVCKAFDEGRYMDLIEVDAASRTKVEDTRDLLDNVQYAPNQGQFKVYLIDEVHMLSAHSFNALLKTLEEPPPHVKFLLATTDPQKIPVTVLSRCLQFNLKRLFPEQINKQIVYILEQENIDFESAAIKLISRAADGSLRDGLSLLDQAISFGNGAVGLETVTNMLGTVAHQPIDEILLALAESNAVHLIQKMAEVAELSPDYAGILQQILRVLHRVSLTQTHSDYVDNEFDSDIVEQLKNKILPEDVQLFYQIGLIGQGDLDLAPEPRIGFEMVMLRMLTFKPVNGSIQLNSQKNEVDQVQQTDVRDVQSEPFKKIEVENTYLEEASQDRADNWAEMIVAMKIRGMTRELANNCVLDKIDDKVCSLILDPGHAQLMSSRVEEKLSLAIQDYSGKPLILTIKTDIVSNDTPAQRTSQKQEDRQKAAVDAINTDETIQALKEHFDARVMPGTIEPI